MESRSWLDLAITECEPSLYFPPAFVCSPNLHVTRVESGGLILQREVRKRPFCRSKGVNLYISKI